MIKYEYLIGIDPDLDKSGVAHYSDKSIQECTSLTMWDLFNHITHLCNKLNAWKISYIVLLEAGHLNKNTWHKGGRGGSKNVGKGQAVGIIIEQFLKAHEINYKLVAPAGYSKFFKDEKLFQKETGWTERTNQDARAAAAIVFYNK